MNVVSRCQSRTYTPVTNLPLELIAGYCTRHHVVLLHTSSAQGSWLDMLKLKLLFSLSTRILSLLLTSSLKARRTSCKHRRLLFHYTIHFVSDRANNMKDICRQKPADLQSTQATRSSATTQIVRIIHINHIWSKTNRLLGYILVAWQYESNLSELDAVGSESCRI